MQLKLAKIILSAIFILFHSSRSEFCHEAHGLIYNDQILIGGNYKSIITRGILVCSHKCLADPACTSYNYERSTESQGACELINEEAESTEVLQERKGSFFVRLRQKLRKNLSRDFDIIYIFRKNAVLNICPISQRFLYLQENK